MTTQFAATIEDGIQCAREWQRGTTAELSQFEGRCLTAKGQAIMRQIGRRTSDERLRQIVTEAVAAGY